MKRSVLHASVLWTSLVLGMYFLEVKALASDLEPQPFDARPEAEPEIWRPDVTGTASHPLDPIRVFALQRRPPASFPNTGKFPNFNKDSVGLKRKGLFYLFSPSSLCSSAAENCLRAG